MRRQQQAPAATPIARVQALLDVVSQRPLMTAIHSAALEPAQARAPGARAGCGWRAGSRFPRRRRSRSARSARTGQGRVMRVVGGHAVAGTLDGLLVFFFRPSTAGSVTAEVPDGGIGRAATGGGSSGNAISATRGSGLCEEGRRRRGRARCGRRPRAAAGAAGATGGGGTATGVGELAGRGARRDGATGRRRAAPRRRAGSSPARCRTAARRCRPGRSPALSS